MKRISKELADKMVMEVLISLSKQNNVSSEFAQNSIDIMNDVVDNTIFTGVLLSKAKPSFFNDNEIDMKLTILSALSSVFISMKYHNHSEFNVDLKKLFMELEPNGYLPNTKLDFALNQFVNAFYEYERLEKKYPELMKIM